MVAFKSIDKVGRTATFTVGGQDVTRRIPAQFAGSIDDYLRALAAGLEVEEAAAQVKPIDTPAIKAGESFAVVAEGIS